MNVERKIRCPFKPLHISTLELFLLEETEGKLFQKLDMSEIYQILSTQSMPDAHSVF